MNDLFVNKIMVNWNHISPDSYLREIQAINQIEEIEFEKPVTYFVGENGSGKSTLLEAIAVSCGFNPEGGSIVPSKAVDASHRNQQIGKTGSAVYHCKPFSHFIRVPDAQIWSFDDGQMRTCSYEETESYQVMEMFINNREIMLSRLLDEEW